MNIAKYREPLARGFFWFAFVCELLVFALKRFDLVLPRESLLLRLFCLLFCAKIVLTHYTKKEWGLIVLCGLLGVAGYFLSDRGIDLFFRASMMVLAAKDISYKKAFQVLLAVLSVTYGWVILQSLIGLKPMYTIDNFGRGMTEIRYVFGFSHANTLHFAMWSLMMLALSLWHTKLRPWHYIPLAVFAFGLTWLTRSRTSGIIMILSIILFFFFDHIAWTKRYKKIIFAMVFCGFLLCLAFSAFVVLWGPDPILWLDTLLTGRVAKAYHGVVHSDPPFQLSLFSTQGNTLYIDMGFIRLLYSYGIVPTLFYLAAIVLLFWRSYQNDDYSCLTFLTGLILLTLIEAQQINCDIVYNFTLVMLFGRLTSNSLPQPSAHPSCDPSGSV